VRSLSWGVESDRKFCNAGLHEEMKKLLCFCKDDGKLEAEEHHGRKREKRRRVAKLQRKWPDLEKIIRYHKNINIHN
jgi:hypothetical protein